MDEPVMLVVAPVNDLDISKRHIAYRKVKEVSAVCGFKSSDGDIGFGIKLLGDPSGDGIQFHAIETAASHIFREHTKEIANTHRRLQNVAGLEAHISYSFVDSTDNCGTGVVGIQRGCAGGGVFFWGQGSFQLLIFGCPAGLVFIKGIRQAAPAHIAGENLLLFRAGLQAFSFQVL